MLLAQAKGQSDPVLVKDAVIIDVDPLDRLPPPCPGRRKDLGGRPEIFLDMDNLDPNRNLWQPTAPLRNAAISLRDVKLDRFRPRGLADQ